MKSEDIISIGVASELKKGFYFVRERKTWYGLFFYTRSVVFPVR